ncbi:MAG: guanylate kinase [Patescibacteria group bacterium]
MSNNEKIIIISGPSGAGEDSVIKGLFKSDLKFVRVVTTITREPRGREKEGSPYYFISSEKFKKMIQNNKFVEWAQVYGDYRGCTVEELERVIKSGKIGIWKIDYQGVKTVKKKLRDVLAIYIKPPSFEAAVDRIKRRKEDSDAEIAKRIEFTKKWLQSKNDKIYDYAVINEEGELDKTVEEVQKIILNFLSKKPDGKSGWKDKFKSFFSHRR